MKKISAIIATMLALCLWSCNDDSHQAPTHDVTIRRLDIALADSIGDAAVMERYLPALNAIALTQGYDTADAQGMAREVTRGDGFRIFAPDARRVYGNLEQQERRLGASLGRLAELDDSIKIPSQIYAYVSPYRQSVVTVDTVMLVALNHYLGENYPGYEGFESYIRRLKTPERMVPDMLEAMIYGSTPYQETIYSKAINRMLYEGAVVALLQRALGDKDGAEALGYTPEEYRWAIDNEQKIWDRLVSDGRLFSMSKFYIEQIINKAPNTSVIYPDSPGRLGRFLGYRIVQSYLSNHPDTPFVVLLSPQFYDAETTLRDSGYRP